MAEDSIKPTPESAPIAGSLSRLLDKISGFVEAPFGYDNPPGQMFTEVTGMRPAQRLLDKAAYGQTSLLGDSKRGREDREDLVNAIPLAATAAKGAWKGAGKFSELASPSKLPSAHGQLGMVDPSPRGKTLEESLAPETHTLRTLENLPQKKAEIPIQTIKEQLKRPEVTGAEKRLIEGMLGERTGTIPAEELASKAKAATKEFQLKGKDSDDYADYGVDRIGRAPDGAQAYSEAGDHMASIGGSARTTQWELPTPHGDTGNHFYNPKYFGHTRAFEEGGIPHIVEIQSDLAQKAGKMLSAEKRAALEAELKDVYVRREEATARQDEFGKQSVTMSAGTDKDDLIRQRYAIVEETGRLQVLEAEILSKLKGSGTTDRLEPMMKHWDRRLIREELARASTPQINPEWARARAQAKAHLSEIRDIEKIAEEQGGLSERQLEGMTAQNRKDAEHWAEKMQKTSQHLPAPKVVRFADADTVAKVEGWRQIPHVERRQQGIPDDAIVFDDQYQGIYDRYKKDIEKYLMQQGGKPHIDKHGHRWIEVPVPKTGKRTPLFTITGASTGAGLGGAATMRATPDREAD